MQFAPSAAHTGSSASGHLPSRELPLSCCHLPSSSVSSSLAFFFKKIAVFIYFWLCWVFMVHGLFSGCGAQASHRSESLAAEQEFQGTRASEAAVGQRSG